MARSRGVQVRGLNPEACGAVCVCVCVSLRVESTYHVEGRWRSRGRGDLVPRLGTEKSLYLHSVSTCLLTGRALVHRHQQFLRCLPILPSGP
jgi:hypothetical protein